MIVQGMEVRVKEDVVIRRAPEYAFWPGTNMQRMPITEDMYVFEPDPHRGQVGTVVFVDVDGFADVEFADGSRSTYHESLLCHPVEI